MCGARKDAYLGLAMSFGMALVFASCIPAEDDEPEQHQAVELTDANFDSLTGSGVVLIDFTATWCGPCQTQAPIVEAIAGQYSGTALVGKVDVDENPVTTARFGVSLIPTLIILKDGVEVWRAVGVQSEAELQAALNAALAP